MIAGKADAQKQQWQSKAKRDFRFPKSACKTEKDQDRKGPALPNAHSAGLKVSDMLKRKNHQENVGGNEGQQKKSRAWAYQAEWQECASLSEDLFEAKET